PIDLFPGGVWELPEGEVFEGHFVSRHVQRTHLRWWFWRWFWEEVSGPTEASICERNRTLFGQILHHVSACVFVSRERANVDNECSRQVLPPVRQFLLF